jgi:hypothetical protein
VNSVLTRQNKNVQRFRAFEILPPSRSRFISGTNFSL